MVTNDMYAMARANGDWFALDHHGEFRVPVFGSNGDAMQARAFVGELLLFRPLMLDENALNSLAPTKAEPAHFWLVHHPFVNMKRGGQD